MHIHDIQEELQSLRSKKRAEIITDTVKLFLYKYPMMENSTENVIKNREKVIIEYLQYLQPEG